MKKIKEMIRRVWSQILKADGVLYRIRIYEILAVVLTAVIFVMFFSSFYSIKINRNYKSGDEVVELRMNRNTSYTMSFESKGGSLDSIRLMIDTDRSSLMSSDKMHVIVTDEGGTKIFEDDTYVYSEGRDYVSIPFSGKSLNKGEWYYLTVTFQKMNPASSLFFLAHQANSFTDAMEYSRTGSDDDFDELSLDHAIGFSKIINIDYRYSYLNVMSLFIHLLIVAVTMVLLFIGRFKRSVRFREAYRAFVMPFYLYLAAEILNVEKNRTLSVFFPLTVKQFFCVGVTILFIILLYLLLYSLIGRGGTAFLIVSVLLLVLAFVNHTKLVMRGDSFMPWDLLSAGIAVKTGSTYYFHITKNFIAGIMMCVVILLMLRLTITPYRRWCKERGVCVALFGVSLLLVVNSLILNTKLLDRLNIYYRVNPPIQSYNENGTYLAFLMHLNNIESTGGTDSSPEKIRELIYYYSGMADSLDLDSRVNKSDIKPNVICIMSEAYTDLQDIRRFQTSEPVMPYYDKVVSEAVSGDIAVSIFGGGTCNTEFEFLTGYSMASLLPGASVYTFYVNGQTEALPQIYKENGYRTVALHPFDGDWWERRDKYPLLGFDEFYTRDDFDEDTEYVRRYISDMATFHKITDIFEESEDPLFLFCVTMQNHADFADRYDNMKYDIKITDETMVDSEGISPYYYAENYLSLLRESDDALSYLIEYLKHQDEPTIVVFFGDHCPTLDPEFYDVLLQTDLGSITLEESMPIYRTPYFIWANYDLSEGGTTIDTSFRDNGITGPNFLGQTLLDLSGMKSPESRSALRVLQDRIGGMSALAIFDKDGTAYYSIDDIDIERRRIIDDYSAIQYGLIYFDDYRSIEGGNDR